MTQVTTQVITQAAPAHSAIDTLLWLGAGVVAFFLILLFWLGSAAAGLVASLRRARAVPEPAPDLPVLTGRPAGI